MADFNVGKFVSLVFGVIVAIIMIVVVAIPIISENQVGTGVANATAINSIINIVPILLVVSILMAIVGAFMYKKSGY